MTAPTDSFVRRVRGHPDALPGPQRRRANPVPEARGAPVPAHGMGAAPYAIFTAGVRSVPEPDGRPPDAIAPPPETAPPGTSAPTARA